MIKYVSAVAGALLLVGLYYGIIYLVNQKKDLNLQLKEHWIVSKSFLLLGTVLGVSVFALELMKISDWSISEIIFNHCILLALAVISLTDYKLHWVSNRMLMFLLLLWASLVGICMILDISSGLGLLFQSMLGGFVSGITFFLCYLVSRHQLGAGDVKLAFIMGLYLTGKCVMGAVFYGVVLCCIYSIIQLIRKKIGLKDGVPLVPFLFVGTIITLIIM